MSDRFIIFFDSECMLCNSSVQWILKHEKKHDVQFAPLHGVTFNELPIERDDLPDSILVWKDNALHMKTSAIIHVLHGMGGKWNILSGLLRVIPLFLSNSIYDFIAGKRYGWFGRTAECMLMKGPMKHRFLD
jgi:predicted DCC family thiol-disulfide oxidoreductase YuxK